MSIAIQRAEDRFRTGAEGRETRHSFSFGVHYDPANVGFAAMTALNDEHLGPGTGYPDHRHADVEILTWVLQGALHHRAEDAPSAVLVPGEILRTSAGSGIVHAEYGDPDLPTRFLQTWLRPDHPGSVPSYAVGRISEGGLHTVVGSGGGLGIDVQGAALRLGSDLAGAMALPDAPAMHLFVVDGGLTLGDRALGPGDAARLLDEGGRRVQTEPGTTLALWSFGR